MKDKLNQFVSNLNGQFAEVSDKTNIYQCMDLVYLWVFVLGYPKATIQHLYAYQAFTEPSDLTREYFEIIPNTSSFVPKDGDIGVFKGGTAGHIGVCLSGGNTSSFPFFEQNSPLGTNAHITTHKTYTNFLGVLRPKYQEPTIISDDEKRSLAVLTDAIKTLKVGESDEPFGNIEGLTRALIGYYVAPPATDPKVVELEGQNIQWQQHFEDIKEHLRPVGVMPGDDLPKIIGAIDGLVAKSAEYKAHLEQDQLNTQIPDQTHEGFEFNGKWNVGKYLIEFWREVSAK